MKLKHRAIIFDLDGTLLDTLQDLAYAVNAVLVRHGAIPHPVHRYRYFVGLGVEEMVRRAFPEGLLQDPESLAFAVNQVKAEYENRWFEHTKPYPGITEFLYFLEEKRIPKAIFSNKPHEFVQNMVDTLLPGWTFEAVQGIENQLPCKPDPSVALDIVDRMGLFPVEVVYLGDTATDIETALAGGFYPAGALWGFRSADELRESGARFLAETPQDLRILFTSR